MKVRILGCGSSWGVPNAGRGYGKTDPNNPKNKRTRSGILIQKEGFNLLIDTPIEIRCQLMQVGFPEIHGLLHTHPHIDHIGGIFDVVIHGAEKGMDIYVSRNDFEQYKPYFYYPLTPDGDQFVYKNCRVSLLDGAPFQAGPFRVQPMSQKHGESSSLGFRIGDFSYNTDVNEMDLDQLKGVKTWVLGCTTLKPVNNHLDFEKALKWIDVVKPERVYFTHMGTSMDYDTLCRELPSHIRPAYDGLEFEIKD